MCFNMGDQNFLEVHAIEWISMAGFKKRKEGGRKKEEGGRKKEEEERGTKNEE